MFSITNYVKIAVERLGGATKTAHATSVSNASVHAWINAGRIPNIDKAKVVAKESKIDVELLRGTR